MWGVGRLTVCRWRLGSASGAYQYPSAGSGELRAWPNVFFSGGGMECLPVPVVGGDGPWPLQ